MGSAAGCGLDTGHCLWALVFFYISGRVVCRPKGNHSDCPVTVAEGPKYAETKTGAAGVLYLHTQAKAD